MDTNLTIQEKIELVINLYTSPKGYLAENINDFPEAVKFLNADCLYLDDSIGVYYINDNGSLTLHAFIKETTEKLVKSMKQNAYSMEPDKLLPWFVENFDLQDDIYNANIFMKYIAFDNLSNYGYRIYLSKRRNKYVLEPI